MQAPIKTHDDLHLSRKIFHFVSIFCIFLSMVLLDTKTNWIIYIALGFPALFIDFFRQNSRRLNSAAIKVLKPILRQTELNKVSGAGYAVISIGIIFAIFPKPAAQLATLMLAVGDPIASAFGLRFGKTKIFGNKSLEGFIAGFLACSLASYLFFKLCTNVSDMLIFLSVFSGLIGAFAELIPIGKLDDNLTQPIISGFFLSLMFYFYGEIL